MLSLFIQVANICQELQNFQTAMQIYSALNMAAVQRLKDEWKALPQKIKQMYTELQSVFASEGNFKAYRNIMYITPSFYFTFSPVLFSRSVTAPAIPLLTVILSDLTMIEENQNKLHVNEGS